MVNDKMANSKVVFDIFAQSVRFLVLPNTRRKSVNGCRILLPLTA